MLLQFPLLWNTKFIPMICFGIVLHICFFGLGYINGSIDFSGRINYENDFISNLFGFLIVVVVLILWLVYYFKNNALKSFYSKSKNALYFEWFQTFLILLLLCSFYIPFKIGKQLHQKSYFSKVETIKRCETIGLADIFIDGYFAQTEVDSVNSVLNDTVVNEEIIYANIVYKDSMEFNSKKYHEYSLMNRNGQDFSVISREKDSLNEIEAKTWLQNNDQEAVKKFMDSYLKIVNQHQLKTNLTTEKWFKAVYKYPNFSEILYIKSYFGNYDNTDYYNEYSMDAYEEVGNYENDKKYSNFFVEQNILKNKYHKVSDAHTDAFFDWEQILAFLYGALGISLLIFSFRVTSGKSWLIAIVCVGVLNIIFGIITFFLSFGVTYLYLVLITFGIIKLYLFKIYLQKKTIGFSKIALNLFLWVFAAMIPTLYFIVQEYFNEPDYTRIDESYYNTPEYEWMNQNVDSMMTLNFVFCVIMLFFISRWIRNWKGIAEE